MRTNYKLKYPESGWDNKIVNHVEIKFRLWILWEGLEQGEVGWISMDYSWW